MTDIKNSLSHKGTDTAARLHGHADGQKMDRIAPVEQSLCGAPNESTLRSAFSGHSDDSRAKSTLAEKYHLGASSKRAGHEPTEVEELGNLLLAATCRMGAVSSSMDATGDTLGVFRPLEFGLVGPMLDMSVAASALGPLRAHLHQIARTEQVLTAIAVGLGSASGSTVAQSEGYRQVAKAMWAHAARLRISMETSLIVASLRLSAGHGLWMPLVGGDGALIGTLLFWPASPSRSSGEVGRIVLAAEKGSPIVGLSVRSDQSGAKLLPMHGLLPDIGATEASTPAKMRGAPLSSCEGAAIAGFAASLRATAMIENEIRSSAAHVLGKTDLRNQRLARLVARRLSQRIIAMCPDASAGASTDKLSEIVSDTAVDLTCALGFGLLSAWTPGLTALVAGRRAALAALGRATGRGDLIFLKANGACEANVSALRLLARTAVNAA
ncbi:MAG: hypothetical protein ACRC14_12610 [Paracoccaceae bacterium]